MPRLLAFLALVSAAFAARPVIFDTDIGSDFDDSAAIAVALSDPELDVKLIVTATGDTIARAQVVAKYLTLFGRTDIPIGVGVANDNKTYTPLYAWAADTNLTSYTGKVYMDGVGAMIDVIRNSPAPVGIIAIAPATNFPSLLSRAPDVVSNAAIYAMSGSIHRGYSNSTTPAAEYNVAVCPACTQLMYAAGWLVFTTPLDTCGTIQLTGSDYNTFLSSRVPLGAYLSESYLYWSINGYWDPKPSGDVWYDSVATLLVTSYSTQYLTFQNINVTVTPTGYTVIDPKGTPINAALYWTGSGEALYEGLIAQALYTGALPLRVMP